MLAGAIDKRRLYLAAVVAMLCLPPAAGASEEDDLWRVDKQGEAPETMTEGTAVDAAEDALTGGTTGAASWFDSFFADSQFEAELDEFQLRLRFDNFFEEGNGYKFNLRASLKLPIPGFNNRLLLSADGAADDDDSIDDTEADDIAQNLSGTDDAFGRLALSYFLANNRNRSISSQVGVRVSGGVAGFAGLRYRELFALSDTWNLRFIERFRWYTDNGFESRTRLQLDRVIFDESLLRLETRGDWYEDESGFFYQLNAKLFQPLPGPRALEYQFINQFETSPSNRLDETLFRVRYRQNIWEDWLIFEVAPQLSFERDNDFEGAPGILLRLEALFGA